MKTTILLVIIFRFSFLFGQGKITIGSNTKFNVLSGAQICTDTIDVFEGGSYITQDTTGTCTHAVIIGNGYISLPVELTQFNVTESEGKIRIYWVTATETNNSGFEIERKAKGSIFHPIIFIEGKGTSLEQTEYEFEDTPTLNSNSFVYRLKQIDFDGSVNYSKEIEISYVPGEYKLYQNFPNPFNPNTTIRYNLPYDSKIRIELYNTLGELVGTISDQLESAGYYEITYDASELSSGIYFLTFYAKQPNTNKSFTDIKKLILLK